MQDELKSVNQYMTFPLNDFEIAERKDILLKELDNCQVLASDLDDSKKRYQTLIKEAESHIEKLRLSIKTKEEMVRVDIYYNQPLRGEKKIVREDNGEVTIEDMDDNELKTYSQTNLFRD